MVSMLGMVSDRSRLIFLNPCRSARARDSANHGFLLACVPKSNMFPNMNITEVIIYNIGDVSRTDERSDNGFSGPERVL